MLSARYVHLIDALGLGALWLKRTAKVITPATRPTLTHTPNAKSIHLPKIQPKPIPQPTPTVKSAIDPSALLAVRCVWAKTTTPNGVSILWLTLRSQLNISAAELIEKSHFGKLLRQLIYAVSRSDSVIWHNLSDDKNFSGSLKLPDTADKIIILSDELAKQIQIDNKENCLILPHPEQLLRQPLLKQSVWEKIKNFQAA
ncbi:MAG: hypothetical protein J6M43_02560 [Neisseriaceae bacterium]|nr:hypothetical protein [Neisseriaceae bacterium]